MKKILVTGGAGFIGSNFIHYLFLNSNGLKNFLQLLKANLAVVFLADLG